MATTRRIVPEEIRLDRAAKRYLDTEQDGNVEAILALNPGLAALGGWVPAGYDLVLPVPDPDALPILPSINPWE